MKHPNYLLLYVAEPAASARFYADLFRCQPVENSPSFALFALDSGLMLGLWSRETVSPAPSGTPGCCDIGWKVGSAKEVDAVHADWQGRGVRIVQAPGDLDFGRCFTAADPDGHRIRVYALAQ